MTTRRTVLKFAAALPAVALLPKAAIAKTDAVYNTGGIAIDGTDAVAYFTQSAPVAGSSDITHEWNGVTWQFASAANRDAFAADPESYAPQYGGYCAWAVSQGYTAETSPDAWTIVDGKLYLNFNKRIRRRWERDIPGNIEAGDANWPGVLA
ncbi:MAG: YHS domain-containing (seleno)protein [Pseudomonadota bacterium]